MISLLEVAERMQRGERMEEKDWDLWLYRKAGEYAKRYELTYPGDGRFFNYDDDLVDRAFQAGIDFLTEVGCYCISTKRLFKFTREEVMEGIVEAPVEIAVGEGRDIRVLKQQKPETLDPLNQCPGHHAPFTEDVASLIVKNIAQMPSADYLQGFSMPAVDGREIFGMPAEAYAAKRQVAWMREGARKAGRPGLAIAYYPLGLRAAVLTAPIDPEGGLRKTDGVLLSTIPDLKLELDLVTAAVVYNDYGCFRVNGGGTAFAGGFCGGPESAIIEGIAKPILGWMAYRDHICTVGVGHISTSTAKVNNIKPEVHWASSVVFQALNKHTNTICFSAPYGASGPGTAVRLYEIAIPALEAPINGGGLSNTRRLRAQTNAGQTPLEARWVWEVARAVQRAGMTRTTAEPVMRELAERLNRRPTEPGSDIRECYDLENNRPSPEYQAIYLKVKEDLAGLGLQFDR